MKRNILSRKEFLAAAAAGLGGLKLMGNTFTGKADGAISRRSIGKTGIMVCPLCFGAPRTNEESLIRYALDKGINFIDTGRSYGNGNNEKLVGRAVSANRKDIVIQSKIRLDKNELPSGGKGKRGAEEIRNVLNTRVQESLKALNTDYIDILLYHDASYESLLFHNEVLKFFNELKRSRTIRAHGFSSHNDFINLHERNSRESIYDVMMVPFNPKGSFVHSVTGNYSEWDQTRLISVLKEAGEKGIGIIAMKTCSGGKYSPSPGIEPSCSEAVRWVISQPFISAAAVAIANFEQVDEHIKMVSAI